ncbi:MAG: glycosyltransferase [Bacteroidales bacterium]
MIILVNLSVAIITYNEEQIIKRTLEAVNNIADEIIIVDSYSTDKTEEICKGFPKVKFLKRKFDGYGTQKNYTIERC